MAITGLHILLTYQCTYECDHCFVWGSPEQGGVFTLDELDEVFEQASDAGSIKTIYFEGGETFIYYPILVKAVARAHDLGFSTGIVTNGYWVTGTADARAWLKPLADVGLDRIEISSDVFHGDGPDKTGAHPGIRSAKLLGMDASLITVDPPSGQRAPDHDKPGQALTGGGVMFRGRAAVKLTSGLPRQPWEELTECPYEDLEKPSRIHLDPFGNLHLCQGLLMGNIWQRPLREIMNEYDPYSHPITAPLIAGGPAQLARQYQLDREAGYVDACHFCYTSRLALRSRFPQHLAPDQMYGIA